MSLKWTVSSTGVMYKYIQMDFIISGILKKISFSFSVNFCVNAKKQYFEWEILD